MNACSFTTRIKTNSRAIDPSVRRMRPGPGLINCVFYTMRGYPGAPGFAHLPSPAIYSAVTSRLRLIVLLAGWAIPAVAGETTATLMARAVSLFESRDFPAAQSQFEHLLKTGPRNHTARVYLIRTLIERGRVVEALRHVDVLLKANPDNPDVRFEAGQLLQRLGEARMSDLQRTAPDSAEAHQLLGHSYEARGQLKEALAEYQLALQRNPAAPGIHFLMGNILWKQRDPDSAAAEFKSELRTNPNHTLANLRLAQIELARDRAAAAVPLLRQALAGDATLLEAHRELGKALRVMGNYEEAVRELEWVARRRPEDNSIHAQLAAVFKGMGLNERANEEMRLHRVILQKKLNASRQRMQTPK